MEESNGGLESRQKMRTKVVPSAAISSDEGEKKSSAPDGGINSSIEDAKEEGAIDPEILNDEGQPRVTFDKVEIREYPRCLGDHPSVSVGPPISLGWKYAQRYLLDLSEYEKYRGDTTETMEGRSTDESDEHQQTQQQPPRRRRCPAEFQLPCSLRHRILREECAHDDQTAQAANTACTEEEIKACIKEVHRTKQQRRSSYALHEFEDIQILVESAWRKLRRLTTQCGGSQKDRAIENDNSVPATTSTTGTNSPPIVVISTKNKSDKDLQKIPDPEKARGQCMHNNY